MNEQNRLIKGYFYAVIAAVTYGLIPLFALPIMNSSMNLDSILFFRFFLASTCLALVMIIKKISFRVTFAEFLTLFTLGVLFTGSSLFLFISYKHMSSGLATSILFVYPIMVALFMRLIFKEKLKPVTFICMTIAIAGVFVLFWGGGTTISILGIISVLVSALTYSFYIIVINKSNVNHLGGLKLTFYSMLITSLIYFIKALVGTGVHLPPTSGVWINMVFLSIIATVVSCVTLANAITLIGSTGTAVLGALDPVTAVLVGIFVFSEPFTWNLALGIILIIGSVTVMIGESRFREFVKKLIK